MPILSIAVDTKAVTAAVKGIRDDQIPFATALALTRTAQDVQAEIRRQLPQRFTIRNSWVSKGIVISKATKRQLYAIVRSRDDFMVLQETGGTKAPRGRHLAVPQGIRGSDREIVTRGKRPRAALRKKRTFVATIRGKEGIWQRTTKKRNPIKMLYTLRPTVPVKARFGFHDTAERTAQQRFEENFRTAFEQAVRTAR